MPPDIIDGRSRGAARRARILVLGMSLMLTNACSDAAGLGEASYPTATSSLSVWAINGTPLEYPTAVVLAAAGASQYESFSIRFNEGAFDLAFDINEDGGVVIYPAVLISSFAEYSVGFLLVDDTFESITRAPSGRYVPDSAIVVQPGQVVAIQAESALCAGYDITYINALMVIDRVALPDRRIDLRVTINPNCGYRSFLAGYPTS